jgi:hypothetical protein
VKIQSAQDASLHDLGVIVDGGERLTPYCSNQVTCSRCINLVLIQSERFTEIELGKANVVN